jgi:hypothetical protein
MYKLILYLPLFIILNIGTVKAESMDLNLSGFATTTVFSDKQWYPNTAELAVNFDLTNSDFAIRGQVSISDSTPLRRLAFEKAFWVTKGQDVVFQVGRFPRLESFFNSVTDSPGSYGVAMIPLGDYNRRVLNNGSFDSIDGIKTSYHIKTDAGYFNINLDYGKMTVDKQCDTQVELTGFPCNPGYKIVGDTGNYDLGILYETGPVKLKLTKGVLLGHTELVDKSDNEDIGFTDAISRMRYDLFKVSAKYEVQKWWVQSSFTRGKYYIAPFNGDYGVVQTTSSMYYLGGYYWTPQFSTYYSFSKGINFEDKLNTYDRVIGASYVKDDLTTSLEYHSGSGKLWERYYAPNNNWKSLVLSVTYRF